MPACSRPGSSEEDTERIFQLVPLATHNQRGRGTLMIGTELSINAERLAQIVEQSMSSPVYELLKRPDELFVVEHAHFSPASSRTPSASRSRASSRPIPISRTGTSYTRAS